MISSFRGASAVRTFNPSFAGAFARVLQLYIQDPNLEVLRRRSNTANQNLKILDTQNTHV